MDSPERLDLGGSGARCRSWYVIVGALVLVLAGLAGVRLGVLGPGPDPVPSTSTTSAPSTSTTWPAGGTLPSGTLYVLAAGGVYSIDARSGLVTPTPLPTDPRTAVLTPMSYGVLVWSYEGGPTYLVGLGMPGAQRPGGVVGSAHRFLAGPDRSIWVSAGDPRPTSTWRLVDEVDEVQATVKLRGLVRGDGVGGLFGLEGSTLSHVYPGQVSLLDHTTVSAVGRDGYALLHCRREQCDATLHDQRTDTDLALGAVPPVGVGAGDLSAGNRFVAYPSETGGEPGIRVTRTGSDDPFRSIPTGDDSSAATWLSDRWLVVTSATGLLVYDADEDVLLTPTLPVNGPTQLVWVPA